MPPVKTPRVAVVYVGPSPAVEGAGFLFPHGEPVEVPADLAESLCAGAYFRAHVEKDGK